MKRLKPFLFTFLLVFAGIITVNAEGSAKLTCAKQEIEIGESTNCVVSGSSDADVTSFVANIETSKYLTISNIVAANGWDVKSNTAATCTNSDHTDCNKIALTKNSNTTITANSEFQVFSFTVTLDEGAKNLASTAECGSLCLSVAYINTTSVLERQSCYNPDIDLTETPSTGTSQPETGAFLNYAIVGGTAFVALVAIIALNSKKKFYQI